MKPSRRAATMPAVSCSRVSARNQAGSAHSLEGATASNKSCSSCVLRTRGLEAERRITRHSRGDGRIRTTINAAIASRRPRTNAPMWWVRDLPVGNSSGTLRFILLFPCIGGALQRAPLFFGSEGSARPRPVGAAGATGGHPGRDLVGAPAKAAAKPNRRR